MSDEKEKEFEELAQFLEYFSTYVYGIDRKSEAHPSNVLIKISEHYGRSKALQVLKQAINDSIEATEDLSFEKLKSLDESLSEQGLLTLSALRKRYWSKYRKIVARGKIRNETEYYLINGLLCNTVNELSTEELNKLNELIHTYEQNA